jgi:hypothetical protein
MDGVFRVPTTRSCTFVPVFFIHLRNRLIEMPLKINMIIMATADTRAGVKRVFKIIFVFTVSMGITNIVPKRGQSIQRNLTPFSACRKRLSVVDSPHAKSETESTATGR